MKKSIKMDFVKWELNINAKENRLRLLRRYIWEAYGKSWYFIWE